MTIPTAMRIFILLIVDHPKFGLQFIPATAIREKQFLNSVERLHGTISSSTFDDLSETQQQIIEICNQYHEQELKQRFGKPKESLTTFLSRIDPQLIENHIRPFIEKRMGEAFELIRMHQFPVYLYDRDASLYADASLFAIPSPAEIVFTFIRQESQIIYRQSITIDNQKISLTNGSPVVITAEPCRLAFGNQLIWFTEDIEARKLVPFFTREELVIPARTEKVWFEKFLVKTVQRFHIEAEGFDIEEITVEPSIEISFELNWQGIPVFRPVFWYQSSRVHIASSTRVFTKLIEKGERYGVQKIQRNRQSEERFLSMMREMGLSVTDDNHLRIDSLPKTNTGIAPYIIWLGRNHEALRAAGIQLNQDHLRYRYYIGNHHLRIRAITKMDWFELNISIQFNGFAIPFTSFSTHILEKRTEYQLPDGSLFMIPEVWFSKYQDLFRYGQLQGETIRVATHHATLLHGLMDGDQPVARKIEELTTVTGFQPVPVPALVKAKLRDYQTEGFQWMVHLRNHRLNGCLADDMGLGKSLQTIALLCSLPASDGSGIADSKSKSAQLSLFESSETPHPTLHIPSMIIMPKTLIFNWISEFRKFAPHLKLMVYSGYDRRGKLPQFRRADVVLTTYGIARIDAPLLKEEQFRYLILDEGQIVKNPASKTYRALLTIPSEHRLTLTGTPVENSMIDLYAQMHFLNRGMLGSTRSFRQQFVTKMVQEKDPAMAEKAQEKLHALIAPFMMRRTKAQVAKELPLKTEQIIRCIMTPEQEHLYETEKGIARNIILEQLHKAQPGKPSALIINALTRLRQIACHPAMVNPETLAGSGKLDAITQNLSVLIEEQHKILVISSYLKHLKLVGAWLDGQSIPYVELTGKTKNHEEVVDQFKTRPDIRVMLMTLKKGGYGLNLTEADYVLIIDPWWNPAAQQQGMDRVYRIGQDKPVFVYKFITAGTVEEKILQMQREKKRIADTLIHTSNPLDYLTSERLMRLLEDQPK